MATGRQGHNKGDKDSGGRFKAVEPVVPIAPKPSHTAQSSEAVKKTPSELLKEFQDNLRIHEEAKSVQEAKVKAQAAKLKEESRAKARAIDASWEPMPIEEVSAISKRISTSMGWEDKKIEFDQELFYKRRIKAVLPDLSVATTEQMLIVLDKIKANKDYRWLGIREKLECEIAFRLGLDKVDSGVADLATAKNHLQEKLEDQGAPYTPEEIVRIRLDMVQNELMNPAYREVTMKVPSGMEISISKPEARAILISMGIKPLDSSYYKPLWPVEK